VHAPSAKHLTDAQRLSWLRLIRSENVGPRTFRNLLNYHGGAAAALDALPDLARRGGALISPKICSVSDAEREIAGIEKLGGRLIAIGEPEYPSALAAADGAPPILSMIGNLECLSRPMVAIVGARHASAAGRSFAARIARELGDAGFTISSGLARGIDASAHEASLSTGTVAALAGGLDRIYPPENVPLLARIVENSGAGLTEMPLGWEPRAQDFPRRNRIIAGLAMGVVIVEAALRSGSLITARLAAELGREVMAAPGSPLDPRCEGSNKLLRDGATLIASSEHVIEALSGMLGRNLPPAALPVLAEPEHDMPPPVPNGEVRARVEELLGPSPAAVDDLIRMSGAPARLVHLILLELELAGRLDRHAGGRVSLIDRL
jgi:DNA processing protein